MSKEILVFFSFRSHKRGYIEMLFERLRLAAAAFPVTLYRGALKDLHIQVTDNHLQVREALTGRNLTAFDTLYFELWYKAPQQALAAALYAHRAKVPFFSQELLHIMPIDKVGEIAVLADNDIPLPATMTSSHRELQRIFAGSSAPFGFPCVVKAADGYGGKYNFLARGYDSLRDILRGHPNHTFVVQAYIPNDCDYRCLVIDDEVQLVLKRARSVSSGHLNNTSQGAEGTVTPVADLPRQALQDVLAAARVLGRSQFAGVDLIIDKHTGRHYILEVNQTPQIEIGAAVDQKMQVLLAYITKLAQGKSV